MAEKQLNYPEAHAALMLACNLIAPDANAEAGFRQLATALAEDADIGRKEELRYLTGALHDGLSHGNWPSRQHK